MWISSRSGLRHVFVAGLETGAAAGLAWWAASGLLNSEQPVYATVAAVVVTGAGFDRRAGKVLSMLKGIGVAIVLSEVGVRLIGSGSVQIAVVTALSIVVARLITQDPLSIVYAGLNAGILVGLGGDGWVPDRLLEALIGAGVAYALIYLALPPRPGVHLRQALDTQIDLARDNLARISDSLRAGQPEGAADAESDSEEIDRHLGSLGETFDFSEEVSRFSPWRRRHRSMIERVRRRTRSLEPVLRDATSLIRIAARLAEEDTSYPPQLAEALDEQASAFEQMKDVLLTKDIPEDRAEAIRRRNDRARALVTDIDRIDNLPRAVIEEILNLANEIEAWIHRPENATSGEHHRVNA